MSSQLMRCGYRKFSALLQVQAVTGRVLLRGAPSFPQHESRVDQSPGAFSNDWEQDVSDMPK